MAAPPGGCGVIISHEHRFIFLKTFKTASSSVELFLSEHAGDDAVVATQLRGESVRHNAVGRFNPVPELYAKYVRREPSLRRRPLRATLGNLRHSYRFYNHMPASLVRARVGRQVWDGYFTFCFERNPWDRLISAYFYENRLLPPERFPPFDEFVRSDDRLRNWDVYTIGGEVAVDFVGRYDRLEADLARALDTVGLSVDIRLERVLSEMRRWSEPAFTPELDEVVRRRYADEIAAFGFTRPDHMALSPEEAEEINRSRPRPLG